MAQLPHAQLFFGYRLEIRGAESVPFLQQEASEFVRSRSHDLGSQGRLGQAQVPGDSAHRLAFLQDKPNSTRPVVGIARAAARMADRVMAQDSVAGASGPPRARYLNNIIRRRRARPPDSSLAK